MSDSIEAFLAAYAAAYERFDGDAVAALCTRPLCIAQGGTLHVLAEAEALRSNMRQLCAAYREAGMARAQPQLRHLQPLGAHDAFALVHWRLLRADGRLLQAFDTGYQLHGGPGGWRVSYVVAFGEDLQALRTQNNRGAAST